MKLAAGASGLRSRSPVQIPAEGVRELHLQRRPAMRFEDGGRCTKHADTFGASGGHVEPVQTVQEAEGTSLGSNLLCIFKFCR